MCKTHHPISPSKVPTVAHRISRRHLLALMAGVALWPAVSSRKALAEALTVDLPAPGPGDTCPVCGMFVARYPEWIATVLYKDGHADHFDGAKDFFKYLLDMPKYAQGRLRADIVGMGVTDYYGVERIDPEAALFVIGSDVLGPMGHELLPHRSASDAEEFTTDHAGKRVLGFDEVTMATLDGLDEGRFE